MKILVLSDLWLPFPGGAERYVSNICRALKSRGHTIWILTSYAWAEFEKEEFDAAWIKDIGVGERHTEGAELIWMFVQWLKPQLILTHHYFAGEFANELPRWAPFVEIVHNRYRHPAAKLAVFNSAYTAQRCGFQDRDLVTLPPAGPSVVSSDIADQRTAIGHIKPLANLPMNGRLYGKGIDLTYRLARIMIDRRFLVLRGEWQAGERIVSLPNVEYLEPVRDIRDFYARCRLVLMPSGSEDAGTVPSECALNGIPCISSDVDGLPETNGGGIRLPLDDIQPWLEEIERLDQPEYYTKVAARQSEYVGSLNWPAQFDTLSNRIEAICERS